MRWSSLLLFSVIAGCSQPKLQAVLEGRLRVEPSGLEVSSYVGFPVERRVAISNIGRSQLRVTVSVSPGLTLLGPAALELAGGERLEVPFRIAAAQAGPIGEALGFTTGDSATEVRVTGEWWAVPACALAESCHRVRFDPSSGSCVDELLPDGSGCEGTCLSGASCQAGTCVGSPLSCDDGNKCTLDSCASDGSCLHLDLTASCPSPRGDGDVACQVPACDPQLGCTLANVVDGTACGPNDCTTAQVCFSGKCQVVTSPEGSACSEATPCQSPGKCVANSCVASPHPIVPSWELLDTPKVKRSLLGVVSPAGLIFGIESHDVGISIIALDRAGLERWRTPLYPEFWGTQALYDVERAQLLVVSRTWARALDGATGAQKWFVELTGEIPIGNGTPTGAKQVYPARVTLLPGAKRFVAAFQEGYDVHVIWVFGLDLVTGQQAFKIRRDGHLYGLMTTSTDELFLGSAGCWQPASWNAAYDGAGVARWSTYQAGIPALTSGPELYFQPYGSPGNFVGRIDLLTGAMSQVAPKNNKAILANGSKLYLTSTLSSSSLTVWDTVQQRESWSVGGVPLQQAFLTGRGSVLGLSASVAAHVSDSGKIEWSCGLVPEITPHSASVLDGQLIAKTTRGIAGMPLGTLKVSSAGWSVSDRGNPERTARAR